jgi:hypothetical protein
MLKPLLADALQGFFVFGVMFGVTLRFLLVGISIIWLIITYNCSKPYALKVSTRD